MAHQRIHGKGPYTHDEANASEAGIYPGMLLELDSAGGVIMHNTENGRMEALFAEEDALQGKTVSDVYTNGSKVSLILPGLGCEVCALLADGEDVLIGDYLVSNGDGCLKKQTDDSDAIDVFTVGVSMEAKNLEDDSAVTNQLIMIRICGH